MTLRLFTGNEQATIEAPSASDRSAARKMVTAYVEEAKGKGLSYVEAFDPKTLETGCAILGASPEQQVAVAVEAAVKLAKSPDLTRDISLQPLLSALLRRNLPLDEQSAGKMIQAVAASGSWELPRMGILRVMQRHVDRCGMSAVVRRSLEMMHRTFHANADHSEERQIGKRIEALLKAGDTKTTHLELDTGEAWADALREKLDQVQTNSGEDWQTLLAHCATAKASQPSKKWMKQARVACADIGTDAFCDVMIATLAAIGQPGASQKLNYGGWTHYTDPTQIHDTHADLLRGLIWTTIAFPCEDLTNAIGDAAESCFQKIPNVGPRSPKIGNACLQALSRMESVTAVAQISRLKTRVKHASVRKQLANALARAADNVGISAADLEEIAVPTCGLTHVGRHQHQVGEFTAELTLLSNGKTQLLWIKPDGRTQKSVPTAIKELYSDEIKSLRRQVKEIEKLLPAQRHRLEQLFVRQRQWTLTELRERFLDHPLVGAIARRLIWRFTLGDQIANCIWYDDRFVDVNDQPITWITGQSEVTIWHPLDSPPNEVLAWREWFQRHEVTQPFKQAHREVYILTDAERETDTYSNRFAAHVIRQHQFAALCQDRGWRYSLEGEWDSANTPFLELPEWGIGVEFWVESIHDNPDLVSERFVYLYLTTDQVRFRRLDEGMPLRLVDVPELVFSEVMRDVDLFVGVASVGNDPNWSDGGPGGHHRDYWLDFAFGDLSQSARTRREVLERVIPRMAIADRCRFNDRFLVVEGKLRTYKIHLGSGNVLMLPNDQYLCIVPKRGGGTKRTDNLFLPFEGDTALSIILSKAFLLAEDDKIKDASIAAQIRQRRDGA